MPVTFKISLPQDSNTMVVGSEQRSLLYPVRVRFGWRARPGDASAAAEPAEQANVASGFSTVIYLLKT